MMNATVLTVRPNGFPWARYGSEAVEDVVNQIGQIVQEALDLSEHSWVTIEVEHLSWWDDRNRNVSDVWCEIIRSVLNNPLVTVVVTTPQAIPSRA